MSKTVEQPQIDNKIKHFDELNKVDVSSKVEQKEGFNYLSWAFAWEETKKHFPAVKYGILKNEKGLPYFYDENSGYMVFTWVEIEDVRHDMWLPVMDFRNKAMKAKPYKVEGWKYDKQQCKRVKIEITVEAATMFDINKTIMRCLTKNVAMFGLGLSVYAGEDLPNSYDESKSNHNNSANNVKKITEKQVSYVFGKAKQFNHSKDEVLQRIKNIFDGKVSKVEDLNKTQMDQLIKVMENVNAVFIECEKLKYKKVMVLKAILKIFEGKVIIEKITKVQVNTLLEKLKANPPKEGEKEEKPNG